MKKIILAGSLPAVVASFLLANAPSVFAKPKKKPAGSRLENANPLVNAAMKNMESGGGREVRSSRQLGDHQNGSDVEKGAQEQQ